MPKAVVLVLFLPLSPPLLTLISFYLHPLRIRLAPALEVKRGVLAQPRRLKHLTHTTNDLAVGVLAVAAVEPRSEREDDDDEGEDNRRRSVEGRAIILANRVNALALGMLKLRAFRDRQHEVFKILAGVVS